jgi:4-amino-4-deoxy-L-arabinose transferase-like glycosyltransferase
MPRSISTALFLGCVTLAFALLHVRHIDAPPNGFHTWREIDTATVAENFATESGDFLRPRVNLRGSGSGVVGMELPLYNFVVAQITSVLGDPFLAARMTSLAASAWFFLAFAWLVSEWSLQFSTPTRLWRYAVFAAAAAPLVFFYGAKIQPDMIGIAAMTTGCAAFWYWLRNPHGTYGLGAAVLAAGMLAVAGSIKPTMLAVGLPMLVALYDKRGKTALRGLGPWLLAAGALTPVLLWFRHARRLTESYGNSYFYLGSDLLGELAGLGKLSFYQNTLLTWPFELVIGLPAIPFFLSGARAIAWRSIEGRTLIAWIVGGFIVLSLAAEHSATPHDYYYLPMVPPLAYLVARGMLQWVQSPRAAWRYAAIVMAAISACYGVLRVDHRYEQPTNVAVVRAHVQDAGLNGLAVAIDQLPGALLFWTGLKGWRVGRTATYADLKPLIASGADYLIIDAKRGDRLAPSLSEHVGPPVVNTPDVVVYGLKSLDGLSPTEPLVVN